jgi:hypothetical protein
MHHEPHLSLERERCREHAHQLRLATREMDMMPADTRATAQGCKLHRCVVAAEPEVLAPQLRSQAADGLDCARILVETDEAMILQIGRCARHAERVDVMPMGIQADLDGAICRFTC